MTIKAYTFDRAQMSALEASKFQNELMYNKTAILSGLKGSWDFEEGFSFTIDTGLCVIQGRFVEISEPEKFYFPIGKIAKGDTMAIRVDLGLNNESTGTPGTTSYHAKINQVRLEKVNESDIQSNDLIANPNSGKFDFVIGKFAEASTEAVPHPAFEVTGPTYTIWRYLGDPSTNDAELYTDTRVSIGNDIDARNAEFQDVRALGKLKANNGHFSIATRGSEGEDTASLDMTIDDDNSQLDIEGRYIDKITLDTPIEFKDLGDQPAINGRVTSADKWTNKRALLVSGDVSGSATFDGSSNATLELSLPPITQNNPQSLNKTIGVNTGAWFINETKVDAKGRFTGRQATLVTVEDQTVGVKQDISVLKADTKQLDTRVTSLEENGLSLNSVSIGSRGVNITDKSGSSFAGHSAKLIGLETNGNNPTASHDFLPQVLQVKIVNANIPKTTPSGNPYIVAEVDRSYQKNGKTYTLDTSVPIQIDDHAFVSVDGTTKIVACGLNANPGSTKVAVSILFEENFTIDASVSFSIDFHFDKSVTLNETAQ